MTQCIVKNRGKLIMGDQLILLLTMGIATVATLIVWQVAYWIWKIISFIIRKVNGDD